MQNINSQRRFNQASRLHREMALENPLSNRFCLHRQPSLALNHEDLQNLAVLILPLSQEMCCHLQSSSLASGSSIRVHSMRERTPPVWKQTVMKGRAALCRLGSLLCKLNIQIAADGKFYVINN